MTVGADLRHHGVRLDVALVNRLGGELPLDHHITRREPGRDVTVAEFVALGHVRGLVGCGIDPLRDQIFVQQRSPRRERGIERQHRLEDFVVDVDQRQCALRDVVGHGRPGRDRVTGVVDLVPRPHVVGQAAKVGRSLADEGILGRDIGEVGTAHHCLHTLELECAAGVDPQDARVSVRAAEHAAPQHARQRFVGPVVGAPGHLVHAIGANGTRSNPLELGVRPFVEIAHCVAPFISAAVCITARMILS